LSISCKKLAHVLHACDSLSILMPKTNRGCNLQ
jgi:hypothetical protein